MRVVQHPQTRLDETAIADIHIDVHSRDDIPAILKGLQYIYVTDAVRENVFAILERTLNPSVSSDTGRPGMALWQIFVLATLKLGLNCDFDRLQELANEHGTLRKMLGHGDWTDTTVYKLQTIIDNVSQLSPAVLADINQVVVQAGHGLVKKKPGDALLTRCDSFVVETDVHYPTDINLLWDAIRKVIELTGRLAAREGVTDWRQYRFNVKQMKRLYRKAQKARYSTSRDEAKKAAKAKTVQQAYRNYLSKAQQTIAKSRHTLTTVASPDTLAQREAIHHYIQHAERQIDQIERRVLNGETIPHGEKVFSVFEPHTEWVSKGKAGVPVELGVRVSVLEDQHQFILHHRIMWQQTDDAVAVPIIAEAQQRYPAITQCSFDKGYYSKDNLSTLSGMLDHLVMPKKGKCNQSEQAWQDSEHFKQARRQHSAVEACINNLEIRGLDRCLSYGRDGFARHVALAIVATNVHRLGLLLQRQEKARLKRAKRRQANQGDAYPLAA